jgi:hypothetical protein
MIKLIPRWIQLIIIFGGLLLLKDHILEALIVLILMYDIGFEIPAIDSLIEFNNTVRRWVYRKLRKRKKKHAK